MARSYRKNKVFSITTATRSNTKDRRHAARRTRRANKVALLDYDPDGDVLPRAREISTRWDWAGDGKMYWGDAPDEALRK